MNHKQRIIDHLDQLEESGVIDYYQIQNKMPGLRWSISINGKSTFSYNTSEMLAFLRGVATMQGEEAPLLAR